MEMNIQTLNVLICCTGSVATIKLPLLLSSLHNSVRSFPGLRIKMQVVMTKKAELFCHKEEIPTDVMVYTDENEWDMWHGRGDPVMHVELAKWADLLLIAPLDANTLAKIAVDMDNDPANFNFTGQQSLNINSTDPLNKFSCLFDNELLNNIVAWINKRALKIGGHPAPKFSYIHKSFDEGMCDNLLTCIVRAWDMNKPLIFCPAMNTKMWNHPITQGQISTLNEWGYKKIECIEKTLVCGDKGMGAMAEVPIISATVLQELRKIANEKRSQNQTTIGT